MSYKMDRIIGEGLTFDDVLIVPRYSEVLPSQVDITTRLTRNITMNCPIVSAAMDTITDSRLAIALAREGGIGIIHKNMTIEQQALEVKRVKRCENGMIYDPVTITPEAKVADALDLMQEFKIGGIPVVDNARKLVGIVTNRDLRFVSDRSKNISEVMTKDNLVTITQNEVSKAAEILQQYRIEKLPVVDEKGRLRVGASIGTAANTFDRLDALVQAGVDVVVVDTAHGHSKGVIDTVRKAKLMYPQIDFIAGNIATGEAAKALVEAGADAVKVGIGPGSICTTRIIAGIGVPQLSAVFDVAEALKGTNVPLIADGGIRYSGDIVKALAAGASCVMLGSLLAGLEESPGDTIIYEGRKFKSYRGMGSLEAMQQGSKDRYFQSNVADAKKLVPEGIVARVPYRGTLAEEIYQLLGGLRSGMGYCGAPSIADLRDVKFVKITSAGYAESHPHDVTITREAPNYSR